MGILSVKGEKLTFAKTGEYMEITPFVNEGQTEREVYLPDGVEWVNVRTKEAVQGGQFITCKAELSEFIAFVKKDKEVLEVFQ